MWTGSGYDWIPGETRANDDLQELTPLIYTPVVGEACQRWSEIYQQPEGVSQYSLSPRIETGCANSSPVQACI